MKVVHSLLTGLTAFLFVASVGSSQAAVIFATSGTDAVVASVNNASIDTYNFTATPGTYLFQLTDLSAINGGFTSPFSTLAGEVVKSNPFPTPPTIYGAPGLTSFTFSVLSAGAFAAQVKAIVSGLPPAFGSYQLQISQVPEPAVWLMMLGGIGLLGWMRLRKSENFG